jgi:hypothetical protein
MDRLLGGLVVASVTLHSLDAAAVAVRFVDAKLFDTLILSLSKDERLVSCPSDSLHISRSAAPGWQGTTTEDIGNI